MPNRIQTLRSSVAGNRPTGRQPGELYVNFPDAQLGVVNASSVAQDLLSVRFFSALTSYAIGDHVIQAGGLYKATAAVSPAAFNVAQWTMIGGSVTVSDTAPANPQAGNLWFDSVGAQLYVYYNDGTSSQWVVAVNVLGAYLPMGGGTLTGPLVLAANPTLPLGAVTKQYSDLKLALTGGALTGPLTGTSATFTGLSAPQAIGENRIINGDMRIDQRNNGASGTANGYTVDRWGYYGSQPNKGNWIRGSQIAPGFSYSLTFGSVSAYTSLAGDYFKFHQPIEADMMSDFAWGTANAQPVTLSFWSYANLGGTYSGAITNGTRTYPFTFSIPAAYTPTKIIITIPGDTAGTWALSGNAAGLQLVFDLGSGSSYRGPANAWASANYTGATGAVSVVATNGANFYVTGVKLEVGSIATPFNRQSLATSLADCQRYYHAFIALQISGYSNGAGASTLMGLTWQPMRTTPTAVITGASYGNGSGLVVAPISPESSSNYMTATGAGPMYCNCGLQLSAEL